MNELYRRVEDHVFSNKEFYAEHEKPEDRAYTIAATIDFIYTKLASDYHSYSERYIEEQ